MLQKLSQKDWCLWCNDKVHNMSTVYTGSQTRDYTCHIMSTQRLSPENYNISCSYLNMTESMIVNSHTQHAWIPKHLWRLVTTHYVPDKWMIWKPIQRNIPQNCQKHLVISLQIIQGILVILSTFTVKTITYMYIISKSRSNCK